MLNGEDRPSRTLASRRSRPDLNLVGSLPKASHYLHQMDGATPVKTPSLDGSSASASSPLHQTPSPVRSLSGLLEGARVSDDEDGGPLNRATPPSDNIARAGKRPSFSRSRSVFEPGTSRAHPRAAFVASHHLSQRRSSEGAPIFLPRDSGSPPASTSGTPGRGFSSLDVGSRSHSRHPTVSSTLTSSGPLTPSDEDAINAAVRFSWGSLSTQSDVRRMSEAMSSFDLGSPSENEKKKLATSVEAQADKSHGGGAGLMGTGHFGPGVRAKVSQILDMLLDTVPLDADADEVIAMCEYGALSSRSSSVMSEIISRLAKRHHAMLGSASNATFYVTHADAPMSDFRPVSGDLEHTDSYTSPAWQASQQPCLTDRAFSAFAGRPRHFQVLPAKSVSVGISLFDLHWARGGAKPGASGSPADQELHAFLNARASEFRSGGLLLMAFIQRQETSSSRPLSLGEVELRASRAPSLDQAANMLLDSPDAITPEALTIESQPLVRRRSTSSPTRILSSTAPRPKRDIWASLTRALAPCVQRLISCGMIKSDVARLLVTLPVGFHPRSPAETAAVLQAHACEWSIEYSAGLEESLMTMTPPTPRAPACGTERSAVTAEEALTLLHPACKALQAGLMGPKVYAEHAIQLVKTIYEAHFRQCLSKRGKLSRSATEWVVDSLMDILREKIEEGALQHLELEATIVALRRK